jgi:hypothetical protein
LLLRTVFFNFIFGSWSFFSWTWPHTFLTTPFYFIAKSLLIGKKIIYFKQKFYLLVKPLFLIVKVEPLDKIVLLHN